jgi:pyrimidine operon attenuation protein/uracil phosphoribosyltransferase
VADTNYILTKEVAEKKMQRMALEVAEQLTGDTDPVVLIGIKDSGVVIAEKIFQLLQPLLQNTVLKVISCTINKKLPGEVVLSETMDFNGVNVIVVDDVTNSGRTLLYAIKPLFEFQPKRIQTLSLVERMHKSFPVKTDYVGVSIATTLQNHIQVEVEGGEVIGAYLS